MPPYFQQLLDLMAQFPAHRQDFLPALDLFTAVEAEDRARIAMAAENIGQMDVNFPAPVSLLEEDMVWEALARLLQLGEEAAVERIIDWFALRKTFARNRWDRRTELWLGAIDHLPETIQRPSARQADQLLSRVVSALAILLKRHVEALKVEGTPKPYTAGELIGGFGNAPWEPGRQTDALANGIRRLTIAWMALHQSMLDTAMDALAAGGPQRFDALMALRDRWRRELGRSFGLSQFEQRQPWADILIPITRLHPGNPPHHTYEDYFWPYEDRTYGFTPYDRDDKGEPFGKRVWLYDMLEVRERQLLMPLDEFGAPYRFIPPPVSKSERDEEQGHLKRLAARRKVAEKAVKMGAQPALGSEDDLARFVCAFYSASVAASGPAAPNAHESAWSEVITFLARYLASWTTHAEFNMDEDKYYFDRLFPRSEAGGAIHDCGVYAVRMAYVFLSLAECAKPPNAEGKSRVSFLILPLHVGLLVEIAGFEPVVLHNHVITRLTPTVVARAEEEWKKLPTKDPTDADKVRDKLLEDMAAQLFLRDVDLPLRREPLPPVGSPPRKSKIWRAYQQLVVKKVSGLFAREIEDAGKPGYQFDTRFLDVLTAEKRWHDEQVVPFWNVDAPRKWQDLGRSFANRQRLAKALHDEVDRISESYGLPDGFAPPPLPSCLVGIKKRPTPSTGPGSSAVQQTASQPQPTTPVTPGKGQINQIRPLKDALTKDVADHPQWIGKEAQRVTVAKRLVNFASAIGPMGQVTEYVHALCAARGPKLPVPPFAAPVDRLTRLGD